MTEFYASFFPGFLANLLADGIIAILLYIAITRPSEKKRAQSRVLQALAMLKEEAQINATRAREYVDALGNPSADLRAHFPLRYTRGAWNALKESGFLPQLQDPRLVYQLLAANEMIVVADASLLRIRKAQRGGKSGRSLARVAKQDSERLLHELEGLVTLLDERGLHKPVVVQQPEAPYRAA